MSAEFVKARRVVAPLGLNIRPTPATTQREIAVLRPGDNVQIIDGLIFAGGGYTWQAVKLNDDQLGWCAAYLGGKSTLSETLPPQTPFRYGLHILRGGQSNQIPNLARQMYAENSPFGSLTLVNEVKYADAVAPFVQYPIFRCWPDPSGSVNPIYPAEFDERFGWNWMANLWPHYAALDPRIYIQPANEVAWHPRDGLFWIGVMQFLESVGRKSAIFADAVGNPTDDAGGLTRIQKWQMREPALRYAATHGHIVALHIYSSTAAGPGELSPDPQFYELRYRDYYAAVPADARPPLILSEAAHELVAGRSDSAASKLKWAKALGAEVRTDAYVKAVNLWSIGTEGWPDSCIDDILPSVPDLLRGRL